MTWADDYTFVEPWWDLRQDAEGAKHARHFTEELQREIGWHHPLRKELGWRALLGRQWRIVAKFSVQDDFIAVSPAGKVAWVHLTWKRGRERLPWPNSCFLESVDDFHQEVRDRYGDLG